MALTILKLIVTELGDQSVGINDQSWEVIAPFCLEDSDEYMLKFFKKDIRDLYQSWCEMSVVAEYEHELKDQIHD